METNQDKCPYILGREKKDTSVKLYTFNIVLEVHTNNMVSAGNRQTESLLLKANGKPIRN